jgi:hypothetical protein
VVQRNPKSTGRLFPSQVIGSFLSLCPHGLKTHQQGDTQAQCTVCWPPAEENFQISFALKKDMLKIPKTDSTPYKCGQIYIKQTGNAIRLASRSILSSG